MCSAAGKTSFTFAVADDQTQPLKEVSCRAAPGLRREVSMYFQNKSWIPRFARTDTSGNCRVLGYSKGENALEILYLTDGFVTGAAFPNCRGVFCAWSPWKMAKPSIMLFRIATSGCRRRNRSEYEAALLPGNRFPLH